MGRNQTILPRKPEDLLFPLLLSRSMTRQGKQGRSLPWMQKYGASSGLLLISRMVLLFCQYVSQDTFLHRVPAWVIRKKFNIRRKTIMRNKKLVILTMAACMTTGLVAGCGAKSADIATTAAAAAESTAACISERQSTIKSCF